MCKITRTLSWIAYKLKQYLINKISDKKVEDLIAMEAENDT